MRLSENNIGRVIEVIDELYYISVTKGTIPLSDNDIWNLKYQLPCWESVLSMAESELPVHVLFLAGKDEKNLAVVEEQSLGEIKGYRVERNTIIQFSIKNPSEAPVHIYMVEISSEGRLTPIPLWEDDDAMWNGLAPRETKLSYPFIQNEVAGLSELRLFSSPKRLKFFLFPPAAAGRGARYESIDVDDLKDIRMKSIRYSIIGKI